MHLALGVAEDGRAQARAAQKVWDENGRVDAVEWERIREAIAEVPLSAIMRVCQVAKSTASGFRSGKQVPHRRHWEALANLHERTNPSPDRTAAVVADHFPRIESRQG